MGPDVAVLERGIEVPPGEFPESLTDAAGQVRTEASPLGIFDFNFGEDLDSLTGNVLGGGSQLYCGVSLEPLPETFRNTRSDRPQGRRRAWPSSLNLESLDPYFQRVRHRLEVERWLDGTEVGSSDDFRHELTGSWAWDVSDGVDPATGQPLRDAEGLDVRRRPPLRRLAAFDQAARQAFGPGSTRTVPIAVNVTRHHDSVNGYGVDRSACTACGRWITGCNVRAKNSLTANYLALAVQHGSSIHTGTEVTHIRPSERPGLRWALFCRIRDANGAVHPRVIHTNLAVVGAGVFGTGSILFNSRRRGLQLSSMLGTRVSGNGDAISIARDWSPEFDQQLPLDVMEEQGPTITRMVDMRDKQGRRCLIQGAVAPEALLKILSGVLRARYGSSTGEGVTPEGLDRSMVMLAMGYDAAQGRLVQRHGRIQVEWPDAGRDPVQLATRQATKDLATAMGADYVANPRLGSHNAGTPTTVHALGGAPMGSNGADCVVDEYGRLQNEQQRAHPGL